MAMMQAKGSLAYTAEGAISEGALVELGTDKDTQVTANANESTNYIGVATHAAADGESVNVELIGGNAVRVRAAGAITAGATLYAKATGEVDDAAGTNKIGTALEAAGADGDLIMALIIPHTPV